jgi:hypothetical protein
LGTNPFGRIESALVCNCFLLGLFTFSFSRKGETFLMGDVKVFRTIGFGATGLYRLDGGEFFAGVSSCIC